MSEDNKKSFQSSKKRSFQHRNHSRTWNGGGKRRDRSAQPPLKKARHEMRRARQQAESNELEEISRRIEAEAPPRGTNPLAYTEAVRGDDYQVQYPSARLFADMPLSEKTKSALQAAKFETMTDIQRAAIPHALCGRDVLGAAKTGSGKTLAFVIPVLEHLYRQRWSNSDGLGALIISPTRELAMQIFRVLCQVGCNHHVSAGLLIGGKDFSEEQRHVSRMNIIVATPGRLQQHMDETVDFDCNNVSMLVLDEADRLLDLGFKKQLKAILANLPRKRQTLLFSATQTKSVRALARLSLNQPEYVSVYEGDRVTTPDALQQHVMVCELDAKLDVLWSFVRSHQSSRIIVFFATRKQVRFAYTVFRRLHVPMTVLEMQGASTQTKRMNAFAEFGGTDARLLLCTDVAARGLDFPSVDWVIQFDCPDDADTYVHRVGRTARFNRDGNAMLMLLPSEESFVDKLAAKRISVQRARANTERLETITERVAALVASDAQFKHLAQKTFISYVRSVYLQADKDVFRLEEMPLDDYAASLGLAGKPIIRIGGKTLTGASTDAEPSTAAAEETSVSSLEEKKRKKREKKSAKAKAAVAADKEAEAAAAKMSEASAPRSAVREKDIPFELQNLRSGKTLPMFGIDVDDELRERNDQLVRLDDGLVLKRRHTPASDVEKLVSRRNATVLSEAYESLRAPLDSGGAGNAADESGSDDFFRRKDGEHTHEVLPVLSTKEKKAWRRHLRRVGQEQRIAELGLDEYGDSIVRRHAADDGDAAHSESGASEGTDDDEEAAVIPHAVAVGDELNVDTDAMEEYLGQLREDLIKGDKDDRLQRKRLRRFREEVRTRPQRSGEHAVYSDEEFDEDRYEVKLATRPPAHKIEQTDVLRILAEQQAKLLAE